MSKYFFEEIIWQIRVVTFSELNEKIDTTCKVKPEPVAG